MTKEEIMYSLWELAGEHATRGQLITSFLQACDVTGKLKSACKNELISRVGKAYFDGSTDDLLHALDRQYSWVCEWPSRQHSKFYGKYSALAEHLRESGSHYNPRLFHSHMAYQVLRAHSAQETYLVKTSQISKLTRDALRFYKDLAAAKGTLKDLLSLIQPKVERLVKVYQGYAKLHPDFEYPKKLTDIYEYPVRSWKATRNSYLPPRLMQAAKELRRACFTEFVDDIEAAIQGIRSYGHICTIALVAEFGEQMNLPATECKAFMQAPSGDVLERAERIVGMLQKAFKSGHSSSNSYTSVFG